MQDRHLRETTVSNEKKRKDGERRIVRFFSYLLLIRCPKIPRQVTPANRFNDAQPLDGAKEHGKKRSATKRRTNRRECRDRRVHRRLAIDPELGRMIKRLVDR